MVSHASILSKRLKLFLPWSSHTIVLAIFRRDPPLAGRRMQGQGVWKNCHFRPLSRFISEIIQDTAILTMADQYRKSYNGLSNGAIFGDLERPLTHNSRSRHYLTLNINQSINQKRIRVTKVTNVTARPLLQC